MEPREQGKGWKNSWSTTYQMIFSWFLVVSLEMKIGDMREQLGFEKNEEFGNSLIGGQ